MSGHPPAEHTALVLVLVLFQTLQPRPHVLCAVLQNNTCRTAMRKGGACVAVMFMCIHVQGVSQACHADIMSRHNHPAYPVVPQVVVASLPSCSPWLGALWRLASSSSTCSSSCQGSFLDHKSVRLWTRSRQRLVRPRCVWHAHVGCGAVQYWCTKPGRPPQPWDALSSLTRSPAAR